MPFLAWWSLGNQFFILAYEPIWKKSNMAAIFKIATRYYKILTTIYIAKWKCYWVNKSASFSMMIPCDLTFKFNLGTTSKKSNMAAIFKMAARYFNKLWAAKWNCCQTDKSIIFGKMIPWKLIFNFSLGATLKKSIMAAIFKMATRYYKVLTTL